jgi:outer membrane protein assembly factor BamA
LPFTTVLGQKKALKIKGVKDIKLEAPKFVINETDAQSESSKILNQLYAASYLSARLDSLKVEGEKEITLYFYQGETYEWLELRKGNLPTELISKVDLNNRLFWNRPFNSKNLTSLFEQTIQYFENNGYPFVSVRLDSVRIDSNRQIEAALNIQKNKYYTLDSIEIKGNSEVSRKYILKQLDIELGEAYNESILKKVSDRIAEVPFIGEKEEYQIQFFEESVKLLLHLEKKQASRFDGVIGILTNKNDSKIELTGDVDLNLINSFNRGENIGLNWRKLKGNSQDLNIIFNYPYFLNTDFGLDLNFKLYKRDTTFLDLISRFGISYNLRRGEFLSLFIESRRSSLLSKNQYINNPNPELPPFGDINLTMFGVGYRLERFDYRLNPRSGIGLITSFAAGKKRLRKIAALEEEQAGVYNGIPLNTNQFDGSLKIRYFIPIGSRSTLLIANKSASIYAEAIYENELFRIGGLKTLRGFDEESIFASTYSIFTLEYRFLLDRNSFFSVFSDGGYYESESINNSLADKPIGIGAGLSFETGAGIFSFNYAIGKQFDNPFDLRSGKIHFGFISLF